MLILGLRTSQQSVGRLHASSPRIFPAPSTGSVPDEVGRQNKKKGEGAKRKEMNENMLNVYEAYLLAGRDGL